MRRTALAMAALVCVLAIGDAHAQRRGTGGGSRGGSSDDNLPPSVPPPVPTLPPTRGISGPRLQVGAVLCRSEGDLQHRADVNRRRAEGETDAGSPLDNCHLLNQERGVDIVARHGLGRTEVKIKPTGEAGWTDSYLP